MRVLTVTHFFEGHGGGIERVAGQLCRQFADLGLDVVWAASDVDDPPDHRIESVPIPCVNPIESMTGLPMPLPGLRGLRMLSREIQRSDAVVIHDALYATSILALVMAKMRGKPTILVQHIAAIPFSSRLLRAAMRTANVLVTGPMLKAADERVFISDTVREDLLGKAPRKPSELLFNGVDSSVFHPGDRRTPDLLSDIDRDGAQKRILFVGRYVEKKGLSVLRALARSRPDLLIVLVGAGPIKPGEWGLANVHDFGPQGQETIADLYRWADLLILPSVGEGFPLVIQEAMACGLPVICGAPAHRADPDASEWLHGVAVDLAQPDASARNCAEAIDSFKLSEDQRAEMSRYALAHYNWREMARKLIKLAKGLQSSAAT